MAAFKPHRLGKAAEANACAFLQGHGLLLLEKNYACAHGEIDLIMQDHQEIVFVEVRFRSYDAFGSAIESVHQQKQAKLIKTALLYLQKKQWLDKVDSRFDIIGMQANKKPEWIKNAFSIDFV